MRRGYLRGLVIGGIVGLAIGKMLRYKENMDSQWEDNSHDNNSSSNSRRNHQERFHKDKEFSVDYNDDRLLDSGFDEEKYQDHFAPYTDEEVKAFDEIVEDVIEQETTENERVTDSKRISRRKKPGRVSLNKRKKMGSLDE